MMNARIGRILEVPGKYAISSVLLLLHGAHYWIEVDEFGDVFQINKDGKRDGQLRPYYWKGDEIPLDPRSLHPNDRWDLKNPPPPKG